MFSDRSLEETSGTSQLPSLDQAGVDLQCDGRLRAAILRGFTRFIPHSGYGRHADRVPEVRRSLSHQKLGATKNVESGGAVRPPVYASCLPT